MGVMIPYESVFMDAMRQSRMMDSNVTPPFHPGLYKYGSQPEGNPGRVQAMNVDYLNLDARDAMVANAEGMQGGEGGAARSYPMYTPGSGGGYTYAPDPEPQMNLGATTEESSAPSGPTAQEQGGGMEQQKAEVEQVAQYGDIPQLLDALRKMAYIEPGQGGNPVFQLDEMYKNSSATQGIPGTVAQYPTAGGITRETDYNL